MLELLVIRSITLVNCKIYTKMAHAMTGFIRGWDDHSFHCMKNLT